MEVMFETNRRFIELLGEQAIHFTAAAKATRGDGGRDLAAFVQAYDAARAINVSLDGVMHETGEWSPDARKVSLCLMDEMVDWVNNLYDELDLVDYYDLQVSEDLTIERAEGRVDVEVDADSLLLLGNETAMFAWCWIDHLLLRSCPNSYDRESRLGQFAWGHAEFERLHEVMTARIVSEGLAEESIEASTAKYLADSTEALRSDVAEMSEQLTSDSA